MSKPPLFGHLYRVQAIEPGPKRRRGGWKQRRSAESDDDDGVVAIRAPEDPPRTVMGLLLDWADGFLSSQKLVRHMANLRADGSVDPIVLALYRNRIDQNCNAQAMGFAAGLPILEVVDQLDHSAWTDYVVPTRYLERISRHYPEQFRSIWGACPEELRDFWMGWFSGPTRRHISENHPYLSGQNHNSLCRTLPIVVFEDAGPYSKMLSCDTICFGSLAGHGPEKTTRVLLATAVKSKDNRLDTKIWDALLADFEKLATKGFTDGSGERWKGILLFAKADEQQRCDDWGLPDFRSDEPCADCRCNRSTMPYTDLRPEADWRPTEIVDVRTFVSRFRKTRVHPLALCTFLHRWFFYPDVMHILDAKGVAAICYGGILGRLIRMPELGRVIQARINRINAAARAWYAAKPGGPKLPRIRREDLVKDDWHVLCGRMFKAAIMRHASVFF